MYFMSVQSPFFLILFLFNLCLFFRYMLFEVAAPRAEWGPRKLGQLKTPESHLSG